MKLKLGQDSEARFGQYFWTNVWLRLWIWGLVEILKMKFNQDLCKNLWCDLNKLFGTNIQPSSPLCLWQCFYHYYFMTLWNLKRYYIYSFSFEVFFLNSNKSYKCRTFWIGNKHEMPSIKRCGACWDSKAALKKEHHCKSEA